MPDLIRHPDVVSTKFGAIIRTGSRFSPGALDVLARLGLLRLPSVARLEFIPYLIRGRNDTFYENLTLWSNCKLNFLKDGNHVAPSET